jgi:fatty-acyl-CoA synthase
VGAAPGDRGGASGLDPLRSAAAAARRRGAGTAGTPSTPPGPRSPDTLLDAIAAEIHSADDALVIYTSGTTARPKGVAHRQRTPVIQGWRFAELMALESEDRIYTAYPFFWTAGIAMALGATLAAGATLLLHEIFEPGEALALAAREHATSLQVWPHQAKAMAEHPDAARTDLSSVRKIEFASPLAKLAGLEKDEWGIYASYGMSETFTLATALPPTRPRAARARTARAARHRGRIVDPHGRPPPARRARSRSEASR